MSLSTQTILRFRRALAVKEMTIVTWARDNNFTPHTVYRLLNGYELGLRGRSLRAAQAMQEFADKADVELHPAMANL